jgi:nitroimidazol reductase NimA-like FMN-containing flavoprotein (pyridoxamine 5'-phosphate oxidase superfamily)
MTSDQGTPVVPTDHTGLRVLTLDECLDRLGQCPVGRVAFHLDGEIAVLPVNHTLAGTDVCFRTLGDSKIQAAVDQAQVAFEVDAYDESARAGWSVLVQGTAVVVSDPADVRRLEGLAREPWVPGDPSAMTWIRVRAQAITGRALIVKV